ncbi:HlyD family type I secretion periplasmic adaptor subunit [Trinickia caryophylli]|uniref:Membrane fusion protein (MFP) family protein n=1 Tax=Trinickia caryophylli TaxID=28094 RepID=A0A1X7CCL7_TRICW|nr:HlyD family type I secretion periplasmic adaptor subunit [Trinickia caryophylli]PMS12511.1 HlyD family type I secretion periplasmic adaptor subunit [Trinickia caryophylli]TRX19713.1 HlyD family type I secretion periplasmic adaptor subunit [Trinickia caryophylli]WQE12972.1 HlyD family type I secretion periplasmic adaptor subunit [Trinickia caryophylli]SME94178.1 hemolysin D [Trinickia caryophylli]GLU30701.1 HlyD family type I secretion periplasmic adaptor subunit [Trinickia caryophylli]
MTPLRAQALFDLLRRYGAVFRTAWSIRRELDGQSRTSHELAFLPANLELVETPVHPLPRWSMRLIVALAALAALVAAFGQLDIVAVAKGRLIPNDRIKVIQPALTGVVRRIVVHDGQRVRAGDLLIELDTTQATADADKARASKIDAALTVARASALLQAQANGRSPAVAAAADASPADLEQAQRFAEGVFEAFEDKLNGSRAELAKREAELATTREQIASLTATAPLARQQADRYHALAADKYVAQTDYLDKEQAALQKEHDLAAQQSRARELAAGIAEQKADIASTISQFRSTQLDTLDKAAQQLKQSSQDETKADTRQKLMSLMAPVAGTVQQLSVHTLGGVVTTAQSLMEIVPDDSIEVEVDIENKDIGFVKAGQSAAVKIDAFPYTRFGYLTGTVVSVPNDAVQDKRLGLKFVARVRLSTNRILANDQWIALTPGMTVTAEIKTGKRSVAHYFFDPVVEAGQESLHER